jgi:hypothetical protein
MTAPPLRIDTVTLTEDVDFGALAVAVLQGAGGALRSDGFPVDWMFRAYEQAQGTPYADLLTQGMATALAAADPMVRAQALVFFAAHPDAAGATAVLDLLSGDRSRFAGVVNPMAPDGPDLQWQLLETLGALVHTDPSFADAACAEALGPVGARTLAGRLAEVRPGWVIAHAEEIVRASPPAGTSLLIALQDTDVDLVELGRRIAPLCRDDDAFEADIQRWIGNPDVRRALIVAYRAGGGGAAGADPVRDGGAA